MHQQQQLYFEPTYCNMHRQKGVCFYFEVDSDGDAYLYWTISYLNEKVEFLL